MDVLHQKKVAQEKKKTGGLKEMPTNHGSNSGPLDWNAGVDHSNTLVISN